MFPLLRRTTGKDVTSRPMLLLARSWQWVHTTCIDGVLGNASCQAELGHGPGPLLGADEGVEGLSQPGATTAAHAQDAR